MKIEWIDGFKIETRIEDGAVIIAANEAGLRSLAVQFTALADEGNGEHYHLDAGNSLEEGSVELIVEKKC